MSEASYMLKNPLSFKLNEVSVDVLRAKLVKGENESLLTRRAKHSFFELEYARTGTVVMELKDREILTVPQGCFALIPPDEYHQVIEDADTGERFITAFSVQPLSDFAPQSAFPAIHTASPACRALLDLIIGCGTPGFSKALPERALFEAFTAELMAICDADRPAVPPKKRTPLPTRTKMISEQIKNCGGIGLGAKELAARLGITPRHLNRIAVKACGTTVGEMIEKEKQKRVETLLASTRLSLKEIASLCGFSDQYAMNRFFRRRTGVTLSQFRLKNPDGPKKRK
ncbi:MAG: helix-turn-helix transcriptional regulator [Clostridia bacterium]|nr:helix-turn-helix transcriptional regulator [Clostridia bacterium]